MRRCPDMLLAIDIGNTNISIGLFREAVLQRRYSIPTEENAYSPVLEKIFKQNKITNTVICSVVPAALKIIQQELKSLSANQPYILGKDIIVPVKNIYRNPAQVGQDRLVNAYAGIKLYGSPLIVVDFGTAVTFDVVSKNSEYLGGMILPGLSMSLDALYMRTALLPKIKLETPKEFIGRDTRNSMLSGIVFGFASLTDNLIERIRKQIGKGAKAVGTGGNIDLIVKYCDNFANVDKDLTLKGLCLIYEKFLKKA